MFGEEKKLFEEMNPVEENKSSKEKKAPVGLIASPFIISYLASGN